MSLEHLLRDEEEAWSFFLQEAQQIGEFEMAQFSLSDARQFIEHQLDKDTKIDHLDLDEYKWFISQLIQLEQAEALQNIAEMLHIIAEKK